MEELILKILELEDKAQNVVEGARQAKNGLDKTVDKETRSLHAQIRDKAEKKCKTIQAYEDKEAEEKIAKIREDSKQKQEWLNSRFAKKKEDWVEEIIAEIIK